MVVKNTKYHFQMIRNLSNKKLDKGWRSVQFQNQ